MEIYNKCYSQKGKLTEILSIAIVVLNTVFGMLHISESVGQDYTIVRTL
jgi:hypothetical protein